MTKNNKITAASKYVKVSSFDSWQNLFTGLNYAPKDKRINAEILHTFLSQNEAEHIYAGDPIARKIVDKIPFEGTREWIEYHGDADLQAKFIEEDKRLQLQKKMFEAWRDARLYGGAGLLLITDDLPVEEWDQPINFNTLKNLVRVVLFNRWEMNWTTLTKDLRSDNFGLPEFYMLTPRRTQAFKNMNFMNIHHSRFIRFDGAKLPQNLFINNRYWHDSVLSSQTNTLKTYHQAHDSIGHIMTDFRQGILRLKGLADMISNQEQAEKLITRIQMMNLTKSVLNTMLLDLDETYDQNTPNLTGVKDLLKDVDNDLVASADMPHNVILGDGSRGKLGDSGKQERMDFFDTITSQQESNLRCPIEYIHNILTISKQGPTNGKSISDDNGFGFDFVPLHNPTEEEESKVREFMAKADKIYLESGVLTPQEVANSRFSGEKYSIDTTLETERTVSEVTPEEEEDIKQATEDAFYESLIMDSEDISLYKLERKTDATQSIIISKEIASTEEQARRIAKKFGAKTSSKVHETNTSFRFRQRDPKLFGGLASFKPPQKGVTIITGQLKGK